MCVAIDMYRTMCMAIGMYHVYGCMYVPCVWLYVRTMCMAIGMNHVYGYKYVPCVWLCGHTCHVYGCVIILCIMVICLYHGTSNSGLSQIRTQFNKPLCKGHSLRSQYNSYDTFCTSEKRKLLYKNKSPEFMLSPKCPSFGGSLTVPCVWPYTLTMC